MSTPTFYHAELAIQDTEARLDAAEAAHARKSRRLRLGQNIKLINGKGCIADCTITEISKDQLSVSVDHTELRAAMLPKLTIATAIPKGDRQRTMLEMMSQLAVTEVVSLDCEHSVSRFKESTLQKWRRYGIESCKQSQNPWLPIIRSGARLEAMVQYLTQTVDAKIFYADGAGRPLTQLIQPHCALNTTVIMIGPEGGFSAKEVEMFERNSFIPLSLSEHILRTEAAAVTAAAQFRGLYLS